MNLLECTAKYRTRNRFDPLGQEYIDADEENRMRIWQEAREVELVEQAQKKVGWGKGLELCVGYPNTWVYAFVRGKQDKGSNHPTNYR